MKKLAGCFQRIFIIFIVMFGLALFAIINSGRGGRPSTERVTIIEASQTPSPTISNESRIENSINTLTDVDLRSIEIADGRANGGEISVIVSYISSEADEDTDLINVFKAIGRAIERYSMNIDAVVLFFASCEGCDVLILVADTDDLLAWVDGEIDNGEFIERLEETND